MRWLVVVFIVVCAAAAARADANPRAAQPTGPLPSQYFDAPAASCPETEWVSFVPNTPYTPEVQAIVPFVWLPQFFFPCPMLGYAIGSAQLPLSIAGGSAQGVALLHSAIMFFGWPVFVFSLVGIPLLWLETYYVAPVSILNALDRDVRCARAGRLGASSSSSSGASPRPPPPPNTMAPAAPTTNPLPLPKKERAEDPLPPPPALRDPAGRSMSMAW